MSRRILTLHPDSNKQDTNIAKYNLIRRAILRELARGGQARRREQEESTEVEKIRTLREVVASVSHEVNNPLAAILMCAESLERRHAGAAARRGKPEPADLGPHFALPVLVGIAVVPA